MSDADKIRLAAKAARDADSIQAAVTAARRVLGIGGGAATYTEDLGALLDECAGIAGEYVDMTRYVELPLDADGVPIRPNDEMYGADGRCVGAVKMVLREGGWNLYDYNVGCKYAASELSHKKPRTLEDALRDARDAVDDEDAFRVGELIREAYELGRRAE